MNKSSKFDMYDPLGDNFRRREFPFYWVAQVNALYTQEMERILKKIDMDLPRWRILLILNEHQPLSISEIAQHAVAKLPTITKILYRMQDQGLVELTTSASDGRVTLVRLTDKGYGNLNEVRDSVSSIFKRSFKGFSNPQIHRINALLEKLFDNLKSIRD
ncbi:MarR family transcriptional regulator [Marinobacterium sp. D7]|uniref:MarR family winged helix-turn-helix transcriptional regulator n=1 Tax=Marinobacterium ramblicola TaxID=2849041 RepID=UPI001C2CD429|nr:MarR family transcriptional regulator [Marinobacterium ramblicola]MBV1789972.1 MarR family transcriptional regulator [Marinobacterium ramblicola]